MRAPYVYHDAIVIPPASSIGTTISFLDLAHARFSCCAFTGEPVTNAELAQLLEAVRFAPTGCARFSGPVFEWARQGKGF